MSKKKFRDFKSAREFARSLGLKNWTEWYEYCKSGKKPEDIPSQPSGTYKNKGWISFGDWFGTGSVANFNKQFRDFESAREFAINLKLKGQKEWDEYCKSDEKPEDIPSHPERIYKNKGWIGFGDWLGTGNVRNKDFRNFESAREFVRSLKLKGVKEWDEYCKSGNKPEDIPTGPDRTYKNKGWIGIGDWLGTGSVARKDMVFRDFKSAREFARSLKLKGLVKWKEYCKSGNKPDDIPSSPEGTYKNKGWIGIGDWLGTGSVAPKDRQFRDFESAREFVRGLKLKGNKEWYEYCKSDEKPEDIPSHPERIYKNKGWIGYGDWLDNEFRGFKSAREFVRSLKLKGVKEWYEYCKSGNKPEDIPSSPEGTYKNKGWIGYGDWLGTGYIHKKDYRDFESAREFARGLKFKGLVEWNEYCKSGDKPNDMPYHPERIYGKKGWTNWGDFLGTGNVAKKEFRDFESAREFARSLKLKGVKEWFEYCKSGNIPEDIPAVPNRTYKNKGWTNWGDWLDNEFRGFKSAREFVRSLKLKSQKEWFEYCKSGNIPEDIPTAPQITYKNKGWINWGDFLGTGRIAVQIKSKQYLPFKEAREEARKLAKQYNIKNWKDWQNAVKKGWIPKNIPSNPYQSYSKRRKKDGKKV